MQWLALFFNQADRQVFNVVLPSIRDDLGLTDANMGLVATVLPLYALSAAMARIGAGKTALIGSVGPILTIFLSIGILDEHLSPLQWAGVGVVLTGIWLVGQRKT